MANIIHQYFPNLTDFQQQQMEALFPLYSDWNKKINVISRKDIQNLYEHHVLHSLAIAKAVKFKAGTRILDLGTGGGFPGIPLAVMFPECHFKLIDGTRKKIFVADEIAKSIGLKNVKTEAIRGEEEKEKFHFIVSRAVMSLPDLVKIVRKNMLREGENVIPNGILCLKGGNISGEIHPFKRIAEVMPLKDWFQEDWFQEKYLIYLPL